MAARSSSDRSVRKLPTPEPRRRRWQQRQHRVLLGCHGRHPTPSTRRRCGRRGDKGRESDGWDLTWHCGKARAAGLGARFRLSLWRMDLAVIGTHPTSSLTVTRIDEAGALRSDRVVLSRPSSLLRPPPTPSRPPRHFPHWVIGGHRFPGRRPGAEEGLHCSHADPLTVPCPLTPGGSWAPAPGSLVPSVAFA